MADKFSIYNDKQYGKVFSYDGEAGIIIGKDGEYVFTKQDIYNDSALAKGDVVAFRVNHLPFPDETVNVAKFIQKEETQELKRKF